MIVQYKTLVKMNVLGVREESVTATWVYGGGELLILTVTSQ